MNLEDVKKIVKALNWPKLSKYLRDKPLTQDIVDKLIEVVYLSDSMVRRRDADDGSRRHEFLVSFSEYLSSAGFAGSEETIKILKAKLEDIDIGYVAVFETESMLPTSSWTSEQRVSAMLTVLQRTAREVQGDILRSMNAAPALTTEPAIYDAQGHRYNPNAVVHNLAAAAFNILMMESYRSGYFNAQDEIVLPVRNPMTELEAEPIIGNYATAHLWKTWKTVDEKTRFLGGKLEAVSGKPDWIASGSKNVEEINMSLEFEANIEAELLTTLAGERFDERQKQTYFRLITDLNLSKYVAPKSAASVDLPPKEFLSVEEGHAAMGLHHALSADIETALVPGVEITIGELLRGVSALQAVSMQHMKETTESFMKLSRHAIDNILGRLGLSTTAIESFLALTTLKRSSRDLYDSSLIREADEGYLLFGWTIATADLLKLVLSIISSQEGDIEDKGTLFEKRMMKMFRDLKFDAKNLRTSRGPNNEFDYDVAFTWGKYAFFFECKNRSLPNDSPIAVYYFNHTVQSHLKQVRRLRHGLETHPDMLDHLPDAVGKKRVFCVLNASPYARPPEDGIYFSDEGLIRRFFDSPSIGVHTVPLSKDRKGPRTRKELARLWKGPKPTPEEFIEYLNDPPQLKVAAAHYRIGVKAEILSRSVIAKIVDLQREPADVEGVIKALQADSSS